MLLADSNGTLAGELTSAENILFIGGMVRQLQATGWQAVKKPGRMEQIWRHPRLCPNGESLLDAYRRHLGS
ncbi:MAG TPA: hypothetical protein VK254_00145 [Candidatus Bathyarchaeia archaeon]|nr:hypothetical protein [Candidatus Bathyarchaeia archaeon]